MDRNADDADHEADRLDQPAEAAGDDDLDRRFAHIVAHWDDVPDLTPTADDLDAAALTHPAEPDEPVAPSPRPTAATRFVPLDAQAWRGHTPPDVEDHFEPPPPEPLPPPEEDPFFWAIVVGLVGGPLLVLWVVIFRQGRSSGWLYAGIAATVIAFVLLVLRKGNSREDDDFGIRL